MQEDVDVIGVSHLSGSHFHHARQIIGEMKESGLQDVLFIMGGVVPQAIDFTISVTGLPVDCYTEGDVLTREEEIFHHVYRVYPTVPSPLYENMAAAGRRFASACPNDFRAVLKAG